MGKGNIIKVASYYRGAGKIAPKAGLMARGAKAGVAGLALVGAYEGGKMLGRVIGNSQKFKNAQNKTIGRIQEHFANKRSDAVISAMRKKAAPKPQVFKNTQKSLDAYR